MNECLFCRIIDKKIPAVFEYESDSLIAIRDINPQAPTHLLVIPKKHIERVSDADKNHTSLLGEMILLSKYLAKRKKLEEGFRLVFNDGAKAGQSVFHVHLHLLGGRLMHWPPG